MPKISIYTKIEHDTRQKYHKDDTVSLNDPQEWENTRITKKDIPKEKRTYKIMYSYAQDSEIDTGFDSYFLKHLFENQESGWYEEKELTLIKCQHEHQLCKK